MRFKKQIKAVLLPGQVLGLTARKNSRIDAEKPLSIESFLEN